MFYSDDRQGRAIETGQCERRGGGGERKGGIERRGSRRIKGGRESERVSLQLS